MKLLKTLSHCLLMILLVALAGCSGYNMDELDPTTNARTLNEMVAPLRFNWSTTQSVTISILGATSSTDIRSTLYIKGSKTAYFKELRSASANQKLTLVIPSNEKSLTFQFKNLTETVNIVSGNATFDMSKSGSALLAAARKAAAMRSAAGDQDGDGVIDAEDEYPADATRAYNNYFPSPGAHGTLAFEDNWPAKGDFDFNDVVVDYNFNTVTNAQNQVVELIGDFNLKASGATFNNGFGFQLDNIAPDKITSVEGASYSGYPTYVKNATNGLEAEQAFANCIVFDQFRPESGAGATINTEKTRPFTTPRNVKVTLSFIKNGVIPAGGALLLSDLPFNLFNFYIVVSGNRGVEVHMPDRKPTSLVNHNLFGQGDDDSAGSSRFYKTQSNLPWAINVTQGFDYPIEKTPINEAYLNFVRWAETSGSEFSNWYENSTDNRISYKVY